MSPKPTRSVIQRIVGTGGTRRLVVRRIQVAFVTMWLAWVVVTALGAGRVIGAPAPPGALLHYLGAAPATTLALLVGGYWMSMRSRRPALIVVLSLGTAIAASFALLYGWAGLIVTAFVFRWFGGEREIRLPKAVIKEDARQERGRQSPCSHHEAGSHEGARPAVASTLG